MSTAKKEELYYSTYLSPVGPLTLACADNHLTGLWIAGQKYHGGGGKLAEHHVVFKDAKQWLDSYFAGKKPGIAHLPLAPAGSAFRQAVWRILCAIPYGKLITYGQIARQMAMQMNRDSMSSQAIGGAVGHNPISIIIPCHRVVGTNGSLTGYAAGIKTKIELLRLEGADMTGLFVPAKGSAL